MSNPYYNNVQDLVDYTRATAKNVEQGFDLVTSGFNTVHADVRRSLRGPSGETVADMPSAINRANKSLVFDASGNPQAAIAATSSEMQAAITAAAEAAASAAEADASATALTSAVSSAHMIFLSLNYT